MTTVPVIYLIRDESIQRLERVVYALVEAAKHCGEPREKMLVALEAALFAKCDLCGAHVSGKDLLIFADWPTAREPDRIRRLRANHCVRPECASELYRLVFHKHPDLDWPKLFSSGQAATPVVEADDEEIEVESKPVAMVRRHPLAVRFVIFAGALLLFFIVHQWRNGGRIPLIREPQNFRVAPAPPGESNLHFK